MVQNSKKKLHKQYKNTDRLFLLYLKFMGSCIVNIFQYISKKMHLYTVYLYLKTALHVSGGTSTHHQKRITNISTASGIYQTVTATCRYSSR
jgi:hypothetical protein